MPAPCDALASALLDSGAAEPLASELVGHAATCLACQAALARHHRLLRILGELRSVEVELPPSLLTDVLGAVERAATRSVVRATLSRHRVGSAIGLGAAAVLIGAVVAVERFRVSTRRRRRAGALETP